MRTRLSWTAIAALCLLGPAACATSLTPGGTGGSGAGGDSAGGAGGSGGATTTTSSTSSSSASASVSASVSVSASASSSSASSSSGGPNLCGNGQLDPGEGCDAGDFGGKDCTTFGLGGGTLQCNDFCGIVVSSCTPKESCLDGVDNDGDGKVDCDDSDDCLMAATCADSCTPPKQVMVPTFDFATTEGRPSVHKASCTTVSGSELMYQFTAPTTDKYTVTLSSFSGADFTLSIRSACGDDASEIACKSTPATFGEDNEVLLIDATQGATYFVMVDTVGSPGGDFDLDIEVPQPESSCSDFVDNDGDGYMDCDDPTSCQGGFDCTPGVGVTGEPCFDPSDCSANKGDPACLSDSEGFPGGYCSEFCDLAANDCAGDAVCAQLGFSVNGICLDGCVGNGDCRPGYTCQDLMLSKKVCVQ